MVSEVHIQWHLQKAHQPSICLLCFPCRCKEDVNWDEVRKEIVKILEDDKYKDTDIKNP